MSWTIEPPKTDEVRLELESAIQDAAKKNILMFCSASDQGPTQSETYPSKATPNILKIGAATENGHPDPRVNINNVNFILPGSVRVESQDTPSTGAASALSTQEVCGSSVAAALAAGLGALILYCAQVRIFVAGPDPKRVEEARIAYEKLRRHENMMEAFEKMVSGKEKFVSVLTVFQRPVRRRAVDGDNLLHLLADVAVDLSTRTGYSGGFR